MFFFLLVTVIVLGLIVLYHYITKNNNFFKKRGISYQKPYFLIGNSGWLFSERLNFFEMVQERFDCAMGAKVFGFFDFTTPSLMIADPDLGKQLFVRHFDSFMDHRVMVDKTKEEIVGKILTCLCGQEWRDMRATLSPAFTGSKMRQMFGLIRECADRSAKFFVERARIEGRQVHEMKITYMRFANDVIASTAFGVQVDSFRDPENLFFKTGFTLMNGTKLKRYFKFFGYALIPKVMKFLNIGYFPPGTKEFFIELFADTLAYREKNNIHRPDMIHLLMLAKHGNLVHQSEEVASLEGFATTEESSIGKMTVKRQWDDEYFAAQCFVFFIGGFSTTSTVLAFLTYELAVNQDFQQRLYEEVMETNESLNGKPVTYDAIQKMTYLDMVISESLRKWPAFSMIERVCTKDIKFEDSDSDFKLELEKGTSVFIPTYAFQMNPEYFPNPTKFDPERFSEENKHNINLATYLPFGTGPRNCIGSRLALLEMKTIIYHLLFHLSFEVCEKTQIPMKRSKSDSMISENGIWIEFKPRNPQL